MQKPSLCIAHSGGVTSILNATAAASILTARQSGKFSNIYAAEFGLNGLIHGRLLNTNQLSDSDLSKLSQTPSSAFGSCRYKLPSFTKDPTAYQAIFDTCRQLNIQYLLYQGGNDSQDTTLKLANAQQYFKHPLAVMGLAKTIDNDLHGTDFCPGYPSCAKYIATSIQEAALDTWAMSKNSTQVFILEVMGRHTGWLALAAGINRQHPSQAPHCILVPETPFCPDAWLRYVKNCVQNYGYCVVVASEGLTDTNGNKVSKSTSHDAFGHQQLGGIGAYLAELVRQKARLKVHWAMPDYLQRSAGHLRAEVDVNAAKMLGSYGVNALLAQEQPAMLGLQRIASSPVSWKPCRIELNTCANHERTLPEDYIHSDTYLLSTAAKDYLKPLLIGQALPAFHSGLPDYFDRSTLQLIQPKITT